MMLELAECLTRILQLYQRMRSSGLTSSSPAGVEGGQECKRVARTLDTTWRQSHGHKQSTGGRTSERSGRDGHHHYHHHRDRNRHH